MKSKIGPAQRAFGRSIWLSSSGLAMLAIATSGALAQTASSDGSIATETVVVSGSRLVTNGALAPTPVTAVSASDLQLAAPRSVVDGLLQLPVFKGSVSVQNQSTGTTGSNGAAYLNMRDLGTSRTLVLLNGRRMVPASSAGSVDTAQIPEALIQRVDVVTGGASAAYGSDAVAGVVNFILNNNFQGVKVDSQVGISEYADDLNYKNAITAGEGFLGGKLHVVGSFLDYKSDGVTNALGRAWPARAVGAIANPNFNSALPVSPTNSAQLVVAQPYSSIAALGGLITNTALKGTTFDANGNAIPFHYGTLVSAAQMMGGDGYNPSILLTLQPSQRRDQFYFHSTYAVGDNFSVYFQAMGSQNHEIYASLPTFELSSTAFTIFSDNAYLPQSIKNYLAANPSITKFTVGRDSPDIAIPTMDAITNSGTITAGFDGAVGGSSSWTYSGYAQMGRDYDSYKTHNDPISDNLYRAADAVINPANGQIVCRSSLTFPNDGCVPLNIFGNGAPSQAAINYVTGTAIQRVQVAEDVFEASAQGGLFDLQGGTVTLAFGAGYRREAFNQTTDAQSQEIRSGVAPDGYVIQGFPTGLINAKGGFERTNPQPTGGSLNVKEAFVETEIPLLKDLPMARSLSFNAAGRYVDYSLSGAVEPWKVGVVWEPTDYLRVRASRSTDIRAPNLGELFQGSSQGTSTVQDPANGNVTVNVLTGAVGNSALVPEESNTSTVGFVFTPDWLSGLTASVDYYQINISKAISTLSAQQELNFCANGSVQQCGFIIRNATGGLSRVLLPFFNAALAQTKGVDFDSSYSAPVSLLGWDGNLVVRALANYVGQYTTQVQGAPEIQLAGGINTSPKWSGLMSANLSVGPGSLFVQERIIGGGQFDTTNNNGKGIYPNEVGIVLYTDATVSYDFNDQITGFFTINNLFDRDPPATPSFLISGSSFGNRTLYDLIGRTYTVGLHYRM